MKVLLSRSFAALIAALLFCECDSRKEGEVASKSKSNARPPERHIVEARPPEVPAVDLSKERAALDPNDERAQFKFLLKFGGTDEDRKRFVQLLESVASQRGVKVSDVAASFIEERPSIDDQKGAVPEVLTCFPTVEERINLYISLQPGEVREMVAGSAAAQLVEERNLEGLSKLYENLPLGKDRTAVAAATSTLAATTEGTEKGLAFIANLEMPEEKYASLKEMNKLRLLNGTAPDSAIVSAARSIVETLTPDQRAQMERLVPVLARKK